MNERGGFVGYETVWVVIFAPKSTFTQLQVRNFRCEIS